MYQNNHNVMTQMVVRAESFGMFYRKNKHKGFSNIVAAVRPFEGERYHPNDVYEKPKKYKNFLQLALLREPENIYLKALCQVLSEDLPCDSKGQLKLI